MKKTFKKAVAVILTMAMAMSVGVPAFAEAGKEEQLLSSSAVYLDADDKTLFAKQMDAAYNAKVIDGTIKEADRSTIDSLIEAVTFAKGTDRENLKNELAEYGVYVYETKDIPSERNLEVQPLADVTEEDIEIAKPTVIYEAIDRQWVVTC